MSTGRDLGKSLDSIENLIASSGAAFPLSYNLRERPKHSSARDLGYPLVPIALTKLYWSFSPLGSGPLIAAVASSGY